jgi:hypothetical protein
MTQIQIDLPLGVHYTALSDRDIVTGEMLTRGIVWTDRPYDRCPRCHEPVNREVIGCPVTLNGGAHQGGQLEMWSQQHGCGYWLKVEWAEVAGTGPDGQITDDDVAAAAEDIADALREAIDAERERVRIGLLEDLSLALARLADPLDEDEMPKDRAEEVRTGSEISPGVYLEDGRWVAWDYDPDGSGDTVSVTANDVLSWAGQRLAAGRKGQQQAMSAMRGAIRVARAEGSTVAEIMGRSGVARQTVYDALAEVGLR